MTGILLKSASFICLIVLGYILKRRSFFGPKDYKILSKIVLNITLPCATIVSFASNPPDFSLLLADLPRCARRKYIKKTAVDCCRLN